jgi:hypothetical protein
MKNRKREALLDALSSCLPISTELFDKLMERVEL